jgi:hypothetical protein
MNFQQLSVIMERLNELTWVIAMGRGWVIALATLAGVTVPLLAARLGGRPRPALSACVYGGSSMLAFSASAAAVSILLHVSDLRWLAPGQRVTPHVSAPGGLVGSMVGGFLKPLIAVANTAAAIPAEWKVVQLSFHTALVCAAIAMLSYVVVLLSRRPARRAAENVRVQVQVRAQVRPLEERLRRAELLLAERGEVTGRDTNGRLPATDLATPIRAAQHTT